MLPTAALNRDRMVTFLIFIHILLALALVGLVLVQRGQGSEIGSAFGSGASQTVFGSKGSANFMTRTTGILAGLFFLTSLSLAYFSTRSEQESVMNRVTAPTKSGPPIQAPIPSQPMPAQSPPLPFNTAPQKSQP